MARDSPELFLPSLPSPAPSSLSEPGVESMGGFDQHTFEQVCFVESFRSIYEGVRHEPHAHCSSTLEACARALRVLEPPHSNGEAAVAHLEAAMRSLVSQPTRCFAPDDHRAAGC